MFADDDFDSNVVCCTCGGGEQIEIPAVVPIDEEPIETVCLDTEGEGRDTGGDSCTWYASYPSSCGNFDDDDFIASMMCCSCNGGNTMVEVDGAVEDAVEELIVIIAETNNTAEVEEAVEEFREYSHSYRPIKDLIDGLNGFGEAPELYLNMTRQGLVEELRRGVNELDHSLTEAKREILREATHPFLLAEEMTEEDVMAAFGEGLVDRFSQDETPEWSIDVDHDEGEAMIESLEDEYDEWQETAEDIWENWQRDREIVDRYYWNYVMQPHLNAGSKLDEKAMRSVVTFIAEGTTVKGRPLTEVFPEVEEAMMSNYNADEESLLEKFGMFNLQNGSTAEYFAYSDCVNRFGYNQELADVECDYLDTYDRAFRTCIFTGDCAASNEAIENPSTVGRVRDEEQTAEDVVEEIIAIEESFEAAIDPHGGAVVYSLHFDENLVNAWVQEQAHQFSSIGAMFETEVNNWMQTVDAINQEHAPRFEEIHEAFKARADASLFDVQNWLTENASV